MKYDGTNFDKVVEMHEQWIKNGMHVDSDNPDVSCADFSCMTIKDIECSNHDLSFANFSSATIYGSRFSKCIFTHTSFGNAKFNNVVFWLCDMSYSFFAGAKLYNSCFHVSDLTLARFTNASFHASEFSTSYIDDICDLSNAENVPNIPMACPDTGSFIGWKKVSLGLSVDDTSFDVRPLFCPTISKRYGIVKLLIPEDAKRSSATGRKCRCDKALVLQIQDLEGNVLDNVVAYSFHDHGFRYIAGEMVTPSLPFEENRWEECASGIHFFISREEAVKYGG